MNGNEYNESTFANMNKEEVELGLALAMTKTAPMTGNDFSIRREPVGEIAHPAQLNQCDIPDPRIVKMPNLAPLFNHFANLPADRIGDVLFPRRGGYKRGQMIIQTGLGSAMSDFAKKSFTKDVVQADGSQNYLKLRNKRH